MPTKKPPQKPTAPPTPKPTTFTVDQLPAPRIDLLHPDPSDPPANKRWRLLLHPDLSPLSPPTYKSLPSLLADVPNPTFTVARSVALYWAKIARIPLYQHAPGTLIYTLLYTPPPAPH